MFRYPIRFGKGNFAHFYTTIIEDFDESSFGGEEYLV